MRQKAGDVTHLLAKVARAGGISHGTFSRFLSGARGAGMELCQGIAAAFNEPVETICRLAGFLPPLREDRISRETHAMVELLDEGEMEHTHFLLVAILRSKPRG